MAGGRPKAINYAIQPGIKQTKPDQWRWDLYSPKRAGGYEKTAELAYFAREAAKRQEAKPPAAGDLPLSLWADQCLRLSIVEPTFSGLRIQNVRSNLERHIKPALGDRTLNSITKVLVSEFINALLRGDGSKDPPSPHTVANIRNDLALILKFAVPDILPENPCNGVEVDRHAKRRDHQGNRIEHKRTLTPGERCRLLAKARSYSREKEIPWLYGFVLLGLRTGLRKSELIGLRWIHVDFKNEVLRIEDQLQHYGGKKVTKDTKSKKSERIIPISPSVLAWIKENRSNGSAYVLADPKTQGPISHRGVAEIFAKVAWRAKLLDNVDRLGRKLADPTPHDMRHTFGAMHANELKTAITVLSELMGHEDIRTTAMYYVDAGLDDLKAAQKGVP